MALIPTFFDDTSRFIDQHFGLGMDMDDLMSTMALTPFCGRPFYRPWRSLARTASRLDSGSKIICDKDKFQVNVDVQQFAPEEITVKTVGNQIVVEGKHEEKQDQHGYISRHFVRKYELPEDYKVDDVISSLSSDGVLSITAPRPQNALQSEERNVPIMATGPAHQIAKEQQSTRDQKMDQ